MMAGIPHRGPRAAKALRTASYSRFWAEILIWASRRCPH